MTEDKLQEITGIVEEIAHAREMATRAPNVPSAERWRQIEKDEKSLLLEVLRKL